MKRIILLIVLLWLLLSLDAQNTYTQRQFVYDLVNETGAHITLEIDLSETRSYSVKLPEHTTIDLLIAQNRRVVNSYENFKVIRPWKDVHGTLECVVQAGDPASLILITYSTRFNSMHVIINPKNITADD